jgi:hypothetical protein
VPTRRRQPACQRRERERAVTRRGGHALDTQGPSRSLSHRAAARSEQRRDAMLRIHDVMLGVIRCRLQSCNAKAGVPRRQARGRSCGRRAHGSVPTGRGVPALRRPLRAVSCVSAHARLISRSNELPDRRRTRSAGRVCPDASAGRRGRQDMAVSIDSMGVSDGALAVVTELLRGAGFRAFIQDRVYVVKRG